MHSVTLRYTPVFGVFLTPFWRWFSRKSRKRARCVTPGFAPVCAHRKHGFVQTRVHEIVTFLPPLGEKHLTFKQYSVHTSPAALLASHFRQKPWKNCTFLQICAHARAECARVCNTPFRTPFFKIPPVDDGGEGGVRVCTTQLATHTPRISHPRGVGPQKS